MSELDRKEILFLIEFWGALACGVSADGWASIACLAWAAINRLTWYAAMRRLSKENV